jgi:hypothetical protein
MFQNPSISSTLRQRKGENISEVSLTVCSGLDMVNINLNHFVFEDKATTEVSSNDLECNQPKKWVYKEIREFGIDVSLVRNTMFKLRK